MFRPFGSRFNLICFVAASILSTWSCPGYSQAPSKTASLISDAQAQVLMTQMLSAQAGGGSSALTSAQLQMLMEYMQARSATAGLGAGGLAQSQMQMMMMQQGVAAQGRHPSSGGALDRSPAALFPSVPATVPVATLGEKKPGVTRIGIPMPSAQLGPASQGPAASEPLRSLLLQYLSGPSVEVTLIAAMLPDQIDAEARSKQCDYLVYSNLTQKKQTGGFGMLRNASSMANMIPMIGMMNGLSGAVAAASAGSMAAQAAQAPQLSSSVKAKSEFLLEYHMNVPGSTYPIVSNTLNLKATNDGQDVFTPLVAQEATTIMAELSKKH